MAEGRDGQLRWLRNLVVLTSPKNAPGFAIVWIQRLLSCLPSSFVRLSAGVFLVAIAATSACTTAGSGEAPDQTVASTVATIGTVGNPLSEASVPSFGLAGIDPSITNAVAPYDHESNVDSQILERSIARSEQLSFLPALNDCLAGEGYEPVEPPPQPPVRDDPIYVSNWQFPQIENLIAEGLVNPDAGKESSEEDPRNRTTAGDAANRKRREAADLCSQRIGVPTTDEEMGDAHRLYWSVLSPWNQVLTEIDNTDEVRDATTRFSECLQDDGVPAHWTTSTTAYLSYVDEVLYAQDGDLQKEAAVREEYGMRYGRCAQDLFAIEQRLRSGELRSAFLAEHEVAIRELASIVGP